MTGNGYFGEMPEFEQLENPNTNLATQIISSDGEILGKYYFNDNRTPNQVCDMLRSQGLDPVWKDWDLSILNN